jgi:hypothetical protein
MNNKPVAWMQTYKGDPNNIAWTKKDLEELGESIDYGYIPLYTHPHPDNLGFALSIIDQQKLRIAELEKELKRTKFAWNLAENELETYLIKVKAQEK